MPSGLQIIANIKQWAGSLLSPASASAQQAPVMPDVRMTNRKFTFDVWNAPIPSGLVWASQWYDTNISGAQYVSITASSNSFGNASTLLLQESNIINDPFVANTYPATVSSFTTYAGGNVINGTMAAFVQGPVRARYWRVVLNNATGGTNTFLRVVATESCVVPLHSANMGGSVMSGMQMGADPGNVNNSSGVMGPGIFHANGQYYQGGTLGYVNYISTDGTALNVSIVRSPRIFRGGQFSGPGLNSIWIPAGGKKLRLMGYKVEVAEDATISGGPLPVNIVFRTYKAQTNASLTTANYQSFGYSHRLVVPATVLATSGGLFDSGWVDLKNGMFALNANDSLIAGLQVPQSTAAVSPTFTFNPTNQWEAATVGFKTNGNTGQFRLVQAVYAANTIAATVLTLNSTTVPGNSIFVFFRMSRASGGGTPTVTVGDSAGNAYTVTALTANASDGANGSLIGMAYCLNAPGAASTVTVTSSVNVALITGVTALEYSGAGAGIDAALVGATGSSTTPASGAYTPATVGDLIFTFCGTTANMSTPLPVANNNFIMVENGANSNGTLAVADNFSNGTLATGLVNVAAYGNEE